MILAVLVAALGYLDLAEIAVKAYDDAHMEAYVREAETVGVQEHGFPRLASNLGRLVAAGRMTEKKPILERMMTVACACARKGRMPPKSGGNEFSVRELVSAVMALEKAGTFPAEKIASWKSDLAAVDAYGCYTSAKYELNASTGRNWPLFGAASEQARIHYGLGGDKKFVEDWVSDQLRHFDRNGMYRDPHEPSVYDFIGRLCYMQILHFGYDGPCRAKVEEALIASAEPTLAMLSACGEIPFGGRSNQFLHNNTMYAAVAEWYAAFFAKRGDAMTAARFRSAAARAIAALEPWVKDSQVFHVKNRFPKPETNGARNVDQKWFGCEGYAYFDKYMVTMGSWAALADEFAEAHPPPEASVKVDPGVFETSPAFHWVFMTAGGYSAQFDYAANPQYDCDGLGRIHRRGAPPQICLSTPCVKNPRYWIEETNLVDLAIAPVLPGKLEFVKSESLADRAVTEWKVGDQVWRCTLSADGMEMELSGPDAVALSLPVFEFDGEEHATVCREERRVSIAYRGWRCAYETDGALAATGLSAENRNGRYLRFEARGRRALKVRVEIVREER